MTKYYKTLKIIFGIILILLTVGPIAVFGTIAFIKGSSVEKFTLASSLMFALILAVINAIMKLRLRSVFWIILIGINACIKDASTVILVLAICSLVDEIIVTPIYNHVSEKYKINKELDERFG